MCKPIISYKKRIFSSEQLENLSGTIIERRFATKLSDAGKASSRRCRDSSFIFESPCFLCSCSTRFPPVRHFPDHLCSPARCTCLVVGDLLIMLYEASSHHRCPSPLVAGDDPLPPLDVGEILEIVVQI